jgi:hypothetical protein
VGGFVQPSSNYHVQKKLGSEAISLEDRIRLCLLAVRDHHCDLIHKRQRQQQQCHHHQQGQGEAIAVVNELAAAAASSQELLQEEEVEEEWLSVWASGDANGVFAAEKCAKYIAERLGVGKITPYCVCGVIYAHASLLLHMVLIGVIICTVLKCNIFFVYVIYFLHTSMQTSTFF